MLDVFFLSYNEPFADEHYELLQLVAPHAKRVHGIKGIFNAHKECAKQSMTTHFYVVDADAIIESDFNFDYTPSPDINWFKGKNYAIKQTQCLHVWRSKNPINGLVYGNGGVKLFPKKAVMNASDWRVDFTTSVAVRAFKAMPQISNINAFNTDPFNTWKSAFRECTKLASKIIEKQKDDDTEQRLKIWCSVGKEQPYGKYCILGAIQGKEYGEKFKDDIDKLNNINDFEWLREKFNK
jgi:hypothetical protein